MSEKWWQETTLEKERKVRWLGVFQRHLPLAEHPAGHLAIPEVQCDKAACLLPGSWLPEARRLQVDTALHPSETVSFSLSLGTERGTVSMAEEVGDLGTVPKTRRPSTTEDRIWERIRLRTPESKVSIARRLAHLLQLPKELLLLSSGPLKWSRIPFPYQIDGINALLSRDSLLLADDMGLGKTLQAVAAMRILVHQRLVECALVVVPAGLVSEWRKELRFLSPELRVITVQGPPEERAYQWAAPAHVFLVSYETLRSDFTPNLQSWPRRRVWDLVILDEAQKIKNRGTEISRKCKELPRRRAWALTGTPLENTPDDLASILEFTRPLAQGEKRTLLLPGLRMLEIHRETQLRRKKTEVLLDLPPKTISSVLLPLGPRQRESYDRAEREGILGLREKGTFIRIENVLELILRLKQICNFCPVSGESSKLQDIKDRLSTLTAEGHRAIIFSQFADDRYGVAAIGRGLSSFHPLEYTGALDSHQRDSVIRLFKADHGRKALVLSLRAGGQGLNLQDASYVFHFDRWWNPAVERQAEDRSHRLGQTVPVHVYKYTCENTVEERIEKLLSEKQRLFDEIVDDVSIDLRLKLGEDELFGLFGLTPPRAKGSA